MKLKYYMRGLGTGIILVVLVYTLTGKNHVMSDLEIMAKARKLGMVEESSSTNNKGILGNNSELSTTPSITQNNDLNSQQKEQDLKQEEDSKLTPLPEVSLEPTIEDSKLTITPIPKETEPTNTTTIIPTITPKAEPTKASETTPTTKPKAEPTKTPEKKSEITPTVSPTKTPNKTSSNKAEETKTTKKTEEKYVYLTVTKGMYSKDVAELAKKKGLVKNAEEFDKYLMDNGYSSRILINTHKIRLGADYKEIAESLVEKKPQISPEDIKE